MPSLKYSLQQPNHYKVPVKQWKKWCDLAQRVFNETYCSMAHNQGLFLHPKAEKVGSVHWDTTCWNAAWTAAAAVETALQDVIDMKGYARKPKKASSHAAN